MSSPQADPTSSGGASRLWIAWILIAIVIAVGVVLTLRLGPRLTPVLEAVQ